ncbi:MAG: FCD domain-containing protein [Hyphomicrobiales bacterium]|nr:FCD domain-containing protein [Hyphomicrobiales bacterium]
MLADLRSNLERQARAVRACTLTRLYELDEQMDRLMAFACRRPGIWEFIQEHKVHVDRIRKLTLFPEHAPNILAQHQAIVAGIGARDPAAASEAMRRHLRFIVENYNHLARRHPEFIEAPRSKDASGKAAKSKVGRPRKLTGSDEEAIIQHIILDGMTGAEVAALFEVSEATISRVRRANRE